MFIIRVLRSDPYFEMLAWKENAKWLNVQVVECLIPLQRV